MATNGYRKKKSGHEAGVPRLETVETLTVENDGRKEGLELKIHKNYSKSAILINPQDSATEKLNTSGSRNGAFRQEERKSKITVYVVIILLTYSVRFFFNLNSVLTKLFKEMDITTKPIIGTAAIPSLAIPLHDKGI